jgi:hypothetical protein
MCPIVLNHSLLCLEAEVKQKRQGEVEDVVIIPRRYLYLESWVKAGDRQSHHPP